jgi:hypothetical protein
LWRYYTKAKEETKEIENIYRKESKREVEVEISLHETGVGGMSR